MQMHFAAITFALLLLAAAIVRIVIIAMSTRAIGPTSNGNVKSKAGDIISFKMHDYKHQEIAQSIADSMQIPVIRQNCDDLQANLHRNTSLLGVFISDERRIILSKKCLSETFFHELGHAYFTLHILPNNDKLTNILGQFQQQYLSDISEAYARGWGAGYLRWAMSKTDDSILRNQYVRQLNSIEFELDFMKSEYETKTRDEGLKFWYEQGICNSNEKIHLHWRKINPFAL